VIGTSQYSDGKLRNAGTEAVIPHRANQKRDVKGLLRVDKKFRAYGPVDQIREYSAREIRKGGGKMKTIDWITIVMVLVAIIFLMLPQDTGSETFFVDLAAIIVIICFWMIYRIYSASQRIKKIEATPL
jgi:hypothetical protein